METKNRFKRFPLLILIFVIFSIQIPNSLQSGPANPPQDKYRADKKSRTSSIGADIILYNANVLTLDDFMPNAEAVAIQGNLILDVGSDEDILALQGTNTQLFDLEQRTVFPGFIDNHSHRLWHVFQDNGFEGVIRAAEDLAADGYTTIHDLTGFPGLIDCAQQLAENDELAVRVTCYAPYTTAGGVYIDTWNEFPYTEEKDAIVRVAGVKIFADGGVTGSPAMTTLYQGGPAEGTYGDIWFSQEGMNTAITEILSAGYPVSMHALGDSGVVIGLNAFENAFEGGGNVLRCRMEHLRIMPEHLRDQMADLGIIASIQYTWAIATSAPTWEALFLPEVLEWTYPWRQMADRGITIAGGNDWPFTARTQAMQCISFLATQKGSASETIPDWLQGKALTVDEGIQGMTVTNAWIAFEEDVKGTITPGKLADLTVVSDDPYSMDPFDVRYITVEMTIMDGVVRHNDMGITHTAIHDAGTFDMGIDDRGLWGPERAQKGLYYNGLDHLWHGTVLLSYDENTIATAISQSDYQTSTDGWVCFNEPGDMASEEATVIYEDGDTAHPGKIKINQNTYMWENEPFLLVKYWFRNTGATDLTDLYLGQFMDFDVITYYTNRGAWGLSAMTGFAYMYDEGDPTTPYIGMAMFDDDMNTACTSHAFMNGYSLMPSFETYMSGIMRNGVIEQSTPEMEEYALLMSAGPYDLVVDAEISPFWLAFAAADSYDDLVDAINLAQYRSAQLTHAEPESAIAPESFILHQNFPNPFNASTTIRYVLPKDAWIDISLLDINGHHIKILDMGYKKAGQHKVIWNPGELASGVYLYRIQSKEFQYVRKCMLIK